MLVRSPQRFSELERAIPGITHKILAQQLRALNALHDWAADDLPFSR